MNLTVKAVGELNLVRHTQGTSSERVGGAAELDRCVNQAQGGSLC
jgi:hypothetical protein